VLKLYDINVEGREVVDVGANIGDTAVFFSRVKKASKVIAIEPLPYVFSLAQKKKQIT
jgi:FkbM family methyltransferase